MRQFLEKKVALAEEAAWKGDPKTVYQLTNEMVGKQSSQITLVKDKNGSIISDPEKIDERVFPILKNFWTDQELVIKQMYLISLLCI